jgi:hypothetical protein
MILLGLCTVGMEEGDRGDIGRGAAPSREVAAAPRRIGVSGENPCSASQYSAVCLESLISWCCYARFSI